jgi:beta-phosphoglucomutase family hydrolase
MCRFAALFDMDGVLVDNYDVHFETWQAFFKKHQLKVSSDDFRTFAAGRTNDQIIPYYFGGSVTKEDVNKLACEKEALYREIYKGNVKPVKGLISFVNKLISEKVLIAVATSAPLENAVFVLNELKLSDSFPFVVHESMIKKGKPDPEIYLKAAQMAGFEPSQCIVFEDSYAGIAAGNAAGMKVVGIATTNPASTLKNCQKVVVDFDELEVKELFSWFN